MAGKKVVDYTIGIGFQVDPKGLKEAIKAVNEINLPQMKALNPTVDDVQIQKAFDRIRKEASQVEEALIKSFNPKLNTYSFDLFTSNLTADLNTVISDFNMLGSTGQNVLAQMAKTLTTTNVQLKQTHKIFDKLGETFLNTIRWQVATKAIQSVTGAIQQGYYFTKDLDKSLNDIRIVTDKSAASMDKFAQKASAAAKELGKSTTDYTNASLIFYQQGLSDKEVAARTETTLKTANVTGQSTSAVSEQLTAVWNGYQIGIEGTEAAVDKLAAVAATSASDLEELSTAMSKVAATANMTGVDIDQLNAQISTIISVTRQAPETVGTALKTIYARISDLKLGGTDEDGLGLGDVSGTLHDLGIEVLDSTGDLRDMGTVIEEIAEKWNYLTTAERTALAQVMGGKRQYTNLVALFDNWDNYTKALETSRNSLGTLQKQQDIYMDSTKAHLQQLDTAKQQLYSAIWDDDTIKDGADALRSMVESVTRIITALGGGKGVIENVLSLGAMFASKQLANGMAAFMNNIRALGSNAAAIQTIRDNAAQFAQALGATGNQQSGQVADYAMKMADNYKNFQLGLINSEQLKYANIAAEQYLNTQIELNSVLENNAQAEASFNDVMRLTGETIKFNTQDTSENVNAITKVVQELQAENEVYQGLYDVLRQVDEASTENIAINDKLTNSQQARVKVLVNEVKEIEKKTKELEEEKKALEELLRLQEEYRNAQSGPEKDAARDKFVNAVRDRYKTNSKGKSIDSIQSATKKVEAEINKTNKKEEELNAQRVESENKVREAVEDSKEKQSQASEQNLDKYKKVTQDFIQLNRMTADDIRNNQTLITQSISQGLVNMSTGLLSTTVQVKNLGNAFQGLASGELKFSDFITSMSVTLPMFLTSISKLTQGFGLLKNAQELSNKVAAQSKLLTELQTHSVAANTIVKKLNNNETLTENELKELNTIEELINTNAININTKSRWANVAAMIAQHAASLAIVGGLLAGVAVYKIQEGLEKKRLKQLKEQAEEENEKAQKSADNSKKELEAQTKLYHSLANIEEQYNNNILTKEELNTQTKELLKSYETENYYLDYLSGKYNGVTEAMRNFNKERREEAKNNAEKANKTQTNLALAESNEIEAPAAITRLLSRQNNTLLLKQIFGGTTTKDIVKGFLSENRESYMERVFNWNGASSSLVQYIQQIYEVTQDNYEAIQENTEVIKEAEKNEKYGSIFGNDILEYNDKNLLELGQQYSQLSTSQKNEAKSFLKNNIGERQMQNIQLAAIASDMSLSIEDIKQLTDDEALAFLQAYESVGTFGKEAVYQLYNVKLATLEANKAAAGLNETLELLKNFDTKNGIRNINDLKESLKDSYSDFEQYITENGGLDQFINIDSPEIQLQKLSEFYDNEEQLIKDRNQNIKEYNDNLDKQIAEKRAKIIELQNQDIEAKPEDYGLRFTSEDKFGRFQIGGSKYQLSDAGDLQTWNKKRKQWDTINESTKGWTEQDKRIREYLTDKNNPKDNTEEIKQLESEISELDKKSLEYIDTLDTTNGKLALSAKRFEIANQKIDNLQSAYSSFNDIIETYNENGAITLDQLQSILAMDYDQLQYLEFENGQLQLNTEAMNEAAKAEMLKAKQEVVSSTYTTIAAIASGKYSEAELQLAYSQDIATGSIDANTEAIQNQIVAIEAMIQGLTGEDLDIANQAYEQMNKKLAFIDSLWNSENVFTAGIKDNTKDTKDLVEAELDIYHDINIELKKIEREIDRINDKREKLLGQDLYDSYTQELGALEAQEGAVTRLLALQRKDAAEKRAELAANGVMFDANGEVSNYNAIKQKWADQVNANPDNEALSKRRDELEELLSGYEELWDEKIPDTIDKQTDIANAKIEAAVNRFNLHMDVTLDLTEMKRAFNDFRRDFIDKTREDDFSHFVEVLYDNMKLAYEAMNENLGHVNTIQAEISKIRAGQKSEIYGDNLAKAVEDLENYNEQLQEQMKTVTDDLVSANEKYAESIDKLTEAYSKQQEYLEKLSQNYEDNAKLMQLLYGENNSSVASLLDQQANTLALSAQKYRAEADRYEVEIAKIQARLADSSLTTETRRALEEEFQTLQDASLEAINNAAAASVAAIEKANEAFEATVKSNAYNMFSELMGADIEAFAANWEATQHYAELYYDDINKAFEVQKLMNKYQKTLNDLTGTAQAKLRAAYDAELKHLKEKDKLTKYDIERAQKKYDLLVAQIALEEAQQNKNTLQLVRDSQGNYNYQYTADASAVVDAQEKVDNLQQELYNLDQNAWKENTEALINERNIWAEKTNESLNRQNQRINKIQKDETLSEKEKTKEIEKIIAEEEGIRNKYQERIKALINERKDIAIHAEQDTKDIITNLDLKYVEDFETETMPRLFESWQKSGESIEAEQERVTNTIIKYQEQIEIANNTLTETISNNGTKAANAYQKIDDKIQKVLIPTQDDYIKKMDEEVTETNKVSKAIEQLAQSYQKLYGDAGTAAEKTSALIELCKQFQELPNKTVTNTVKNVTINETKDVGNGIQNLLKETKTPPASSTPNQEDRLYLNAFANKKAVHFDENNNRVPMHNELIGQIKSYYLGENETLTYDFSNQRLSYKALDDLLFYQNNLDNMPFEKYGLDKIGVKAKQSRNGINIYLPWSSFITHYLERIGVDPLQTEGLNAVFRDINNNVLKTAPAMPSSPSAGKELSNLYDLMNKTYLDVNWAFKSGGYTGDWGDSGRWALLHQKELVLNSVDTANLLETIKYQREITQMQMAAAATSEKTPSTMTANGQLDQNVYIEASFPGVQNANEIEAALNNLVNAAAQRANSNLL